MTAYKTRFTVVDRPQLVCPPEDRRTKSEFADDCDINLIMARYKKTGILPDAARAAAAKYGDFSAVPTFAEMQDKIAAAQQLFLALPATVRKAFDNDPHQFLNASQTAEGRDLMVKLGLGKAEEPSAPPSQPAASSAPVAPASGDKPEAVKGE